MTIKELEKELEENANNERAAWRNFQRRGGCVNMVNYLRGRADTFTNIATLLRQVDGYDKEAT
jgi:hypothetical protein